MSTIIEKAHELGHALSESNDAAILNAAEVNLDQDSEAQDLIKKFQDMHKDIQDAEQEKREISDEYWEDFNKVQEKMKENKAVQAYFAALNNFQKLLQDANAEINKVLTGGESCSDSDCSSCSMECEH